jgi:thiol-disulfide isomerase/thioredoxin
MQKQSVIAGGVLGLVAFVAGIYLIGGDERKAGEDAPPPPANHDTMGGGAASEMGVSRDLATGTLTAFVIKKQRAEVPAIAFADAGGKAVSLADWKGRVVLVNLWATWCAPCKKEMPDLAKLQTELGSPEFEVVAVSIDRKGAEASGAFLAENNAAALKLYTDPTAAILDSFQAIGLPATILIDREGREIGRLLGPADWASPEAKALIRAAIAEGKTPEAKAGG